MTWKALGVGLFGGGGVQFLLAGFDVPSLSTDWWNFTLGAAGLMALAEILLDDLRR